MKPEEILEENYKNALEMAINENSNQVSNNIKSGVDIFIEKLTPINLWCKLLSQV